MRFPKTAFRLAVVAAIIVLVAGCLTQRTPLQVRDRPIKTETHGELTATVRFVDEAILESRYKDEVNPFRTDYYRMQLRRVIVFEVTVKNDGSQSLLFLLNRLELQYGGKTFQPYNRFHLVQHWEFTDEEAKAIHKTRREKIIEEMVLPNSYTLPAGGIMRGYVVFLGNTPNYGSAKLYLPLFRSKDVGLHRFEFPFEF